MWDLGFYSMIGVFVSSPTGIVIRIYIVECNYCTTYACPNCSRSDCPIIMNYTHKVDTTPEYEVTENKFSK